MTRRFRMRTPRIATSKLLRPVALAVGAVLLMAAGADRPAPRLPRTHLPMPTFIAATNWLAFPPDKAVGDITAVAVDRHDNVWVLHRPRTLAQSDRAKAAPPVLEFDAKGRYLNGFGGAGSGYEWPTVEHSLAVDGKDRVWIAGNFRGPGVTDDMILVFDSKGRFLRQIGRRGASLGDSDTANLHAPADIFVDDRRHEVYVADGYGNRRVIVFDSESGAFRRMWGAFGSPPPNQVAPDPRPSGAPFVPEQGSGPAGFNGVHGVEIARDGRVYVSDRNNQRIQAFTRTGRYLGQVFVNRNMASAQTASGMAFSTDPDQRYLYVADWGNAQLVIIDRRRLAVVGTYGSKGKGPGQFLTPHLLATDSKGVLYVAEVQGRRVQRLVPPGRARLGGVP